MSLEVFTFHQIKLQNALSWIFPTVLLLPPSCRELPPYCSLSFYLFTCFLSVVFKCFDHLPTLTTRRDQTPLGFLLRKKKRKNGEKREEEATRFSPSIWSAHQVFQREGKSFRLNFQFYLTYCPYVILLEL
jgi:hypothetical protein